MVTGNKIAVYSKQRSLDDDEIREEAEEYNWAEPIQDNAFDDDAVNGQSVMQPRLDLDYSNTVKNADLEAFRKGLQNGFEKS